MSNLNKNSVYAIIVGSLFYWLSFTYLDQPIAYSFHSFNHSGVLYSLNQLITLFGDAKVSLIFISTSLLLGVAMLLKDSRHQFAKHLILMAIAMMAAIFVETSLKYVLGRYRPGMLFSQGLYGFHYFSHQFLLNSTPSGHATRVFVLVTGFSLAWKRLTPLFVVIGLLVCLSRLILEFHYLSDVMFGAFIGTFVTLWIFQIYHSLILSSTSLSTFRRV